MPASPKCFEDLNKNWSSQPTAFPELLIEPKGITVDYEHMEDLIDRIPERHVVIRRSAENPGGDMDKLSAADVKGRLEEVLKNDCIHIMAIEVQEVDDTFGSLLGDFTAALQPVLTGSSRRLIKPMVGYFLSSPGSIAHYHVDPDHNFLLQLKGSKVVHVFPTDDYKVLSQAQREKLFATRTHQLRYQEPFESVATVLELHSGQSYYQPPLFPHWVEVGSEVSFSLGFSISTQQDRGRRLVYTMNHRLRKLGLEPTDIGMHPARDRMKALAEKAVQLPLQLAHSLRG